ncbi:uncharacterized protein [Saccopteryx bilineata]|uniref:uncharacterized protein isoform X3 n=1 Tax=Saccopteryx bilineata TaxID=59482 RepID=UPI00338DD78F
MPDGGTPASPGHCQGWQRVTRVISEKEASQARMTNLLRPRQDAGEEACQRRDVLDDRGQRTETGARRIFGQLISALQYCRWDGVTHRDPKPENVLVDEEMNCIGFHRGEIQKALSD